MAIVRALFAALALLGYGSTLAQDDVGRRSSPPATVLRDTVAGGLVGSAVAGGIILYEMGIDENDDYDWGRTLAWGAVIGLGAGLVFGIFDANRADYATISRSPVRDGQSMSLDLLSRDQSGKEVFPILGRRF
jgi:hypothetical protein